KPKDFVQIEFTGRVKDTGEIFDSNIKEDMEKLHAGHDHEIKSEPFVFALGEGMFLKAIDDFLLGKPGDKSNEYNLDLEPEKAFGKRNSMLVQTMPMKIFREKNVNPVPGTVLNFDGRAGKILTVSGGRVMVDFNHSLAGKSVSYKIKFLKKIIDMNDKINAVNKFFFGKEPKFQVDGKKLIVEVEKQLAPLGALFKDKYKEILDLDLETKESKETEENPKKSQ
ncbi:MAG: hypothetical protein BV456_11105, partial [Thermoplasmata archaeon M8B2D]